MNNYANGVASIYLANLEKHMLKPEVYLIEIRRNTLVALLRQPQAFEFFKTKIKLKQK